MNFIKYFISINSNYRSICNPLEPLKKGRSMRYSLSFPFSQRRSRSSLLCFLMLRRTLDWRSWGGLKWCCANWILRLWLFWNCFNLVKIQIKKIKQYYSYIKCAMKEENKRLWFSNYSHHLARKGAVAI